MSLGVAWLHRTGQGGDACDEATCCALTTENVSTYCVPALQSSAVTETKTLLWRGHCESPGSGW